MVSTHDVAAVRAATAYSSTGDKIGRVGNVYVDDLSQEPAWVTISAGFFGSRTLFAPLAGARIDGDRLVLAYSKDAVEAAPGVADSGHISDVEQQQLFDYYQGLAGTGDRLDAGTDERLDDAADPDVRAADLTAAEAAEPVVSADDPRVVEHHVPEPGVAGDLDEGHLRDLDRAATLLAGAGGAVEAAGAVGAAPVGTVPADAGPVEGAPDGPDVVAVSGSGVAVAADGPRDADLGPVPDEDTERRPDDPAVLDATADGAVYAPVPLTHPTTDPGLDAPAPDAGVRDDRFGDDHAGDDRAADAHEIAAEDAQADVAHPAAETAAPAATSAPSAGGVHVQVGHTREEIVRDADGNVISYVKWRVDEVWTA